MGTCVIAADTLNEGYQSMEGRARMSKRREERGRRKSIGEITAEKKVVKIEEKRVSQKKKVGKHL